VLEYIFFTRSTCDRFVARLRALAIAPDIENDGEAWLVAVPEDLDEPLADRIETFYDELMDADRELVEADCAGQAGEFAAAGVTLELNDGRRVYAHVDPALLLKISRCLESDELNAFVSAICDAVEHPDERGFCQRMRDEESGK